MKTKYTLLLLLLIVAFIPSVQAFGAGNIPSYASVEGKAFRHGDIMDAIGDLYKKAAGGILAKVTSSKFSSLDVKRIYFYDFLRDYSQAMDTAALSKVDKQTILNVVMVMSFLAFGYATQEFEVTDERLGVYLPIEHIDNPKGYPDDAQRYDPRLRPPVQQIELEIDPNTGMKNYIANDRVCKTSTALIRERLHHCIEFGRRYKNSKNSSDEHEAFRWLGTSMHTLADFPAHSNFAEIYLYKLGYTKVFPHVGDNVRIRAPGGEHVPPIVTGTFGGMDFMASVLGEAGDHLTSASVSDLNDEIKRSTAKSRGQPGSGGSSAADTLRDLIFQLDGYSSKVKSRGMSDGGGGQRSLNRDFEDVSNLSSSSRSPDQMSPQEMYATLWKILSFRDRVSKTIEVTIDKIPGLSSLVDKISNSIAVFIYSTLEPFMAPLIKQAKDSIGKGSEELLSTKDQLEVYNDPNCSDPTHSGLSKDHFDHLLNNPCGNLAMIIVVNSTKKLVEAWGNNSNPDDVISEILEAIHHPYFADGKSKIQSEMGEFMRKWVKAQGPKIDQIERGLSKESCKDQSNKVHSHVQSVHDPHVQTQEGMNPLTSGGLWGLANTNASGHDSGGHSNGGGYGGDSGGNGGKNSLLSSMANLGINALKNDNKGNSKQPPPSPSHSRPTPSHASPSPYQQPQSHGHSHTSHASPGFPQADYGGRRVTRPPTPPGRNTPYQPYSEPPPMPDPGYMPGPGVYAPPPPMNMPMGMSSPPPPPMGMPGAHMPHMPHAAGPGMYSPPPMPMQSPPYGGYPQQGYGHGHGHGHGHGGGYPGGGYPGGGWR